MNKIGRLFQRIGWFEMNKKKHEEQRSAGFVAAVAMGSPSPSTEDVTRDVIEFSGSPLWSAAECIQPGG